MAESSSPTKRKNSMDEPNKFMEDSSSLVSKEQLLCSICLDVFTDPVTTPCGHNFCKSCLTQCWEKNQHCYCPLCEEKFTKKPELKINTTLREVANHFKKNSASGKPYVFCDSCIGEKLKALKSCLDCRVSLCKAHLGAHYTMPKLKEHTLINPVEKLEDYICQKHDKPLELFCKDDQMCVCQICTEEDHKNHNTVPIEKESKEKKTQLEKTQTETQQMIQERLKKIQDIKHSVELSKRNTEKEKADSVEVFTALIRSIEKSQAELLNLMEEKQKAAEMQAEGLIKELEQEVTVLQRRDTELEQLSQTEENLHLLQNYSSMCIPPQTKNWTEISINTDQRVDILSQFHVKLNEKLNKTLNDKLKETVSTELKRIQQYAVDVTLDPDTAHPKLILSADGKQVKHGEKRFNLPDTPERFDFCPGVVGKQSFSSGRFYYEVQVRGKTEWTLGVVRENSNRKGDITLTPRNGFWTVILRNENQYKACASPTVLLTVKEKPTKVGVFVDYEAGLVSFYDVEASSHIYSFTAQSFTEKLYPFCSPSTNKLGKNSAPLIISSLFKTE